MTSLHGGITVTGNGFTVLTPSGYHAYFPGQLSYITFTSYSMVSITSSVKSRSSIIYIYIYCCFPHTNNILLHYWWLYNCKFIHITGNKSAKLLFCIAFSTSFRFVTYRDSHFWPHSHQIYYILLMKDHNMRLAYGSPQDGQYCLLTKNVALPLPFSRIIKVSYLIYQQHQLSLHVETDDSKYLSPSSL
jgi:hypothetical protein